MRIYDGCIGKTSCDRVISSFYRRYLPTILANVSEIQHTPGKLPSGCYRIRFMRGDDERDQ